MIVSVRTLIAPSDLLEIADGDAESVFQALVGLFERWHFFEHHWICC